MNARVSLDKRVKAVKMYKIQSCTGKEENTNSFNYFNYKVRHSILVFSVSV